MRIVEAIVLGLVQGITEFLPISSSAHLVLVPWALGWPDAGLRFAVVTNAATLLAAIVFFRRDLVELARRPKAALRLRGRPGLAAAGLAATLPVVLVGTVLRGWLETGARAPWIIVATTVGFALLLGWADRTGRRTRTLADLGWRDAWIVGLAQAVALVPGTSRSGITITAALARGFTREEAARFSFLLAIPTGLLALGYDLVGLARADPSSVPWWALAVGFAVAGVSAFLAIGALLRWLARQTLAPFVVYRVLLGAAVATALLVGAVDPG